MIERQFVSQKLKEYQIQEYMAKKLAKAGYSHTEVHRTPLGEKVIVYTTKPGLVVGKRGENIRLLTEYLKKKFKLENPQVEIGEVINPMLDVQFVADKIAASLERFGPNRFKSIGYRMLQDILNAGALGAEIVVSGKVPSARARSWRFKAGYLKKSGDIAQSKVKKATVAVNLKAGTIGIKVSIMPPDVILPDKITLAKKEEPKTITQQIRQEVEKKEETKEAKVEIKEGKNEKKGKKKEEKEKADTKPKTGKKTKSVRKEDGDSKKK